MTDPVFQRMYREQNDPFGDIRLPEAGDPYDSRWGGPVPWDQRLQQWSNVGTPLGERPFEGLGKVDLAQTLPTAPVMPRPRQPIEEPSPLGPPQPGFFESLTRGLTGMVTQFIPNQDIQNVTGDIAGFIGSLPDFPLRLIPTLDFLPGGGNMEEVYAKVAEMTPTDGLRLQYEQYMANDEVNRLRYMSEYLNSRSSEVAQALGITGMAAPMFTPSLDFSEQLRRLLFGGLTAAGDTVNRTFAGSLRNVEGSILQADIDSLPDELKELRSRYEQGALTYDQMLDELALGRYRWTNDDSMLGMGLSFVMDVISDPLTWASFGIGGVLKTTATGSVRLGISKVAQAVEKAGRTEDIIGRIAKASGKTVDEVKGVGSDTNRLIHDWVKNNDGALYQEGLSNLTKRQRAMYELEPIVSPVADIVNRIDNPFSWLSPIPNGISRYLGSNIAKAHTKGYFSAYGFARALSVQKFFGDVGLANFQRYAAISAENLNVALHQRALDKEVLATDPDFRGVDPDAIVRARRGYEDGLVGEAEELQLRRMESALPPGVTGEAAYKAGMDRLREALVEPLAEMSGRSADEARAFLASADKQTLAFIHSLNYGRTIDITVRKRIEAVKAIDDQMARTTDPVVLEQLRKDRKSAEHLTLISERLLTKDQAELVLKALNGDAAVLRQLGLADPEKAARWAVNQFDQLDAQYADAAFDDARLATEMRAHIKSLLRKGPNDPERLVTRLSDEDLERIAPDLVRALGKQDDGLYSVGLMPEDRWGRTYDETGKLVGVNSFVDIVTDGVDDSITRAFGRRDAIRHGLLDGITGSRLHHEARERFIELGLREYGLNKGDAKRLFDAIRAESMKREIGARGFRSEDIVAIAHELGIKRDKSAQRIGERGLLELTVRAWEGEMRTVGLSAKVSGKFKSTAVQRTNNLVGRIAESLYPFWRFGLSPMFLAMELTEGPFFALLRGVKLGVRYTEDDIRLNSILEFTKGQTRYMDQLEKAQLAAIESRVAREWVGRPGSRFTRFWNKLAPERWHRAEVYKGARVSGIYSYKELLYIRQWGKDAAEEMRRNAMATYPEAWRRWEAELGTSDPTKIFIAMMEERGLYDTSVRHNLHMFDATKPASLGRKERIRLGDVSNFVIGGTVKELKDAVRGDNPTLTRDEFIHKYTRAGLSREYAERAYSAVHGLDKVEWEEGIRAEFGDANKVEAEAFINLHHLMATIMRRDFAEFMNDSYGGLPNIVDNARAIPTGSMYQTLKEVMRRSGMPEPDAKALARMSKRTRELLPPPLTERIPDEKSPGKFKRTAAGNTRMQQVKVDTPEGRAKYEAEGTTAPPKVKQTTFEGAEDIARHEADVVDTFGSVEEALAAASWYDEMPTLYYGIVQRLPSEVIRKFNQRLDAKFGKTKGRLDPKEELAVRMNLAFAVSQQNTKVIDGFRFVWQMLDESLIQTSQRGYSYGLDGVVKRMESVITALEQTSNQEMAAKLYDFADSLARNPKRSHTSLVEGAADWQPAAMDIWMKRYFGYADSEYFRLKVEAELVRAKRANAALTREQAEEAVLKDMGWTRDDVAQSPGAPDALQYEYMLAKTNELKDSYNKHNFLGRSDWKAWEVQAMMWVKTQKDVNYVEAPPTALLVGSGKQVTLKPLDYADAFSARYPTRDAIVQSLEATGLKREEALVQAEAVLASIAHDVTAALIPIIKEETGVGVMRVIDTAIVNADGSVTPTANLALFGAPGQIDEAIGLLGALQQQGDMAALTRPSDMTLKADKPNPASDTRWTLDFKFAEDADQHAIRPYLQHLDGLLERVWADRPEWLAEMGESLTTIDEFDRLAIRNIYEGNGNPKQYRNLRDDFTAWTEMPPDVMRALETGEWVKEFDPSADPAKFAITVERNIGRVRRSTDHKETIRGAGRADPDKMVGRHTQAARDIYDEAYARRAPDAFKHKVTLAAGANPGAPSVYYAQRRGGPGARGPGSIRAAFNAGAHGHGAATYFIRGAFDPTTAIHESFHLFARHLDDSAKRDFLAAYNAATGRRKRTFDVDVEEWVAYEFEKWAAGDVPGTARHAHVFAAYRKWYKKNAESLGLGPRESAAGALFEDMLERVPEADRLNPATWNADEQRFWEATRIGNLRAEQGSHATVYYRRDRNVIERSINHPYLGLYPASYMWGKVLPELVRFLVHKPFGIDAPFGGLILANHAWRNLQLQLQTDEELRKFIDDHPDTIRFLQLMVPGTPWEMPANAPLLVRRSMEAAAENVARRQQGLEPKEFDPAGWLQDTITYSIGLANLTGRISDMVGEFVPDEEEEEEASAPMTLTDIRRQQQAPNPLA